jgi:cold-inducible RNA-binding protein
VSVRLFVGNLPYQATEDDVRKHFGAVADPVRVAIPVDRETGRPRGFAFVEFAEAAQAQEAIRQFNGQPFLGRNLAVNEARAREDRGPASGPRPPMAPRSSPGPGGPPARSDGTGVGGAAGRGFGPASRRARGGAKREREERRPSGPIPVKFTGRVYDVDAVEDTEEPIEDFDNFATSLPDDEAEDEQE